LTLHCLLYLTLELIRTGWVASRYSSDLSSWWLCTGNCYGSSHRWNWKRPSLRRKRSFAMRWDTMPVTTMIVSYLHNSVFFLFLNGWQRIRQLEGSSKGLIGNIRQQAEKHVAELTNLREQIQVTFFSLLLFSQCKPLLYVLR
jgi:hypothetical protein